MNRFVILPKAKPIISAASRASVESYFIGRTSPQREASWLDIKNRYRVDCTHTFEDDVKRAKSLGKPLSASKHKQLTAYVSASAPTHVIDGWSFLGRAVDCALRGDTYSAAHFAYYAELRAAMALLASEGIGIFSRRHAVIGDTGSTPFPKAPEFGRGKNAEGTHRVVWPVFRFWSSLRRASELLDELIQPEQISLSTWLSAKAIPVSAKAIGQRWLAEWGIDLETVREDHDTRNLASYRPSALRSPPPYGANNTAEFVTSLWRMFEPGIGRRFPEIERQLLRRAVRTGGGLSPNEIEQIGFAAFEAANWNNFFSAADESLPFYFAESATTIEESTCHLRMISRAALLLFVASGSSRQLLQNAGYTTETIAFWWKQHGIDRGLWSPSDIPDDPMDAWADVTIAIEELAAWGNDNANASLRNIRQLQQQHISELGAFELIGIWSLLP
jgi:hypothetical protein